MHRRFFSRDLAIVYQALHVGVVTSELDKLTVAKRIAAEVAHVAHAQPGAREQQGGEGSAHALRLGVVLDFGGDAVIAVETGGAEFFEEVIAGFIAIKARNRGNHQLRGHFAGGVTAHAICNGEQAGQRRQNPRYCRGLDHCRRARRNSG